MVKKEKPRNIGIPGIDSPKKKCKDVFCPFHGKLGVRGRIFNGVVISVKPTNTAVIEWERRVYVPLYERFEKRKSRIYAHLPSCLNVHENDTVVVGECRPISKTKKFAVLKKVEEKR